MPPSQDVNNWPELPYAAWKDTRDTLHLWMQIVGKIRLMQTPWLNHSWHVVLYVTARSRSISTSSITCCWCGRAMEICADSCSRRCRSPNSIPSCSRR